MDLQWCGSSIVTLARPKYELPDDGHRPKYVGAFNMNFNANFSASKTNK